MAITYFVFVVSPINIERIEVSGTIEWMCLIELE